jgi:hypothetical protein
MLCRRSPRWTARLARDAHSIAKEKSVALKSPIRLTIQSTRPAGMMRKRWLVLVLIYLALLLCGWIAGRELFELFAFGVGPQDEVGFNAMIAAALGVYIVTSATPFVPGAEIGFGLILLFGARIAPLVYSGMVLALSLSFLIGRFVPPSVVARGLAYFGLVKARDLVLQMAPLSGTDRLDFLTARAPRRLVPFMLRHRYLALILVLNLPGNSIIGGGGGIGLVAGLSGLYSFPAYLGALLIAVAPIPLMFIIVAYFS